MPVVFDGCIPGSDAAVVKLDVLSFWSQLRLGLCCGGISLSVKFDSFKLLVSILFFLQSDLKDAHTQYSHTKHLKHTRKVCRHAISSAL